MSLKRPHSPPFRVTLGALTMGLFLAHACGATTDTRPPTDDDFRAVQLAEASAEAGHRQASEPDTECRAACHGATHVCEARVTICDLARETEDLDLRARCRAADDRCTEARGRSGSRCPCLPANAP